MEIIKEEHIRNVTLTSIAKEMMIAARTAPKGKGADNIVLALVDGQDIVAISQKLKEMGERYGVGSFVRDAENILHAPVVLLMGTKVEPLGLKKCGLCGFRDCDEKRTYPSVPCAFNTGDLGIAMGSAVSVAMDRRVDNRIMYTVGQAVLEMGLLGEEVKVVYAIPLSATSKNPFFDRAG